MSKFGILLILFTFPLVESLAQNDTGQPNQLPGDKEMEEMIKEFENQSGFLYLDSLMIGSWDDMDMLMDTTMLKGFLGDENISLMFEEFFPRDMDPSSIDALMEQSLRMLESMDETQMKALLDAFDFSKVDEMFKGFNLEEFESLMDDFNLDLPENYIDSLQQERSRNKNLKRI